jgi:hypothetical protein
MKTNKELKERINVEDVIGLTITYCAQYMDKKLISDSPITRRNKI